MGNLILIILNTKNVLNNRGFNGEYSMVMQYLVSRNEEYIKHIENFNKQIGEICELIKVLEYNILEIQMYLKASIPDNDDKKKEAWYAKQK